MAQLRLAEDRIGLEDGIVVGGGHGWGGGLLLAGTVTMRHNRIYENYSPSGGGGVFADEGAVVTLDHELI